MIHVLDFEGKIIDYVDQDDLDVYKVLHKKTNESETLDIEINSEKAEHFKKRHRVIIQDKTDKYREFIIDRATEESGVVVVEATASYLVDLKNARPLQKGSFKNMGVNQKVSEVLRDSGWEVNDSVFAGITNTIWDKTIYANELLTQIADEHKIKYEFEVVIDGYEVTKRYVNIEEPVPLFKGREIVYGKDLESMKRSIDFTEVRTALYIVGPEEEKKPSKVTMVVDDSAQEQFGDSYHYIWDIFEPSDNVTADTSVEELQRLGKQELAKRNSAALSYELNIVDLEQEFPHEVINFGDIVRIKNPDFVPSLYAESEVIGIEYELISGECNYTFGNIVERKEDELLKYFRDRLYYINQKLNDGLTNVNTIVADTVANELQYVEKKIFKGAEPPENPVNDILWLDTSNPKVAVLRRYWNGEWINSTAENAKDVGAVTREQALFSELKNTFLNLDIQHAKLLKEVYEVLGSEYLVDSDLKASLNAKIDDTVKVFQEIKSNLDSMTDETATIGKLVDTQALFLTYREKLQALYNVVENAKIAINNRFKLLQSQYTDEKYNEAMEKVASSINGTWNAETGQLIADIPNEARLEEIQNDLTSAYESSLNSVLSTLRNETDSKIVNTKNEISATVSKVDEKITGLTIGGRNLFQAYNSNFSTSINKDIVSTESFTGRYWATNLYSADFLKTVIIPGETYTYSYEIEIVGLSEKEVPAVKKHGIIFYSATDTKNNILSYRDLERVSGNKFKATQTFVAPTITDHRFVAYSGFYSDDGTTKYPASSNLVKISKLKLEKGTKATDWTPAPEDTTNKIATAQANAEAAAKAYADAQDKLRKTETQAYADGIVTAEEQRAINDAKAKLQEAKTYAEQQKQIAIDTANDNIEDTVEPIKTTIVNNENSIKALEEEILLYAKKTEVSETLNTELQPIKKDVNDQKAQLSVMSDEINSKVSLNDYTTDKNNIVQRLNTSDSERQQLSSQISDRVTITQYNSGMTQKTNEINTAVSNIKIGGVNMLDGTKDFTSPFNTPNVQKYGEVINGEQTSVDYDSVNNRLMWSTFVQNIPVQPNTDYTISYDAKTKDGIAQGVAYTPITRLQDDGTLFNPQQYVATTQTYKNTTNEFQRYSYTFNTGTSKRIRLTFTSKDVNSLTNIKKVKLEIGNKATPYEQSPNDISNAITKARSDAEVSAKAYADAQDKLSVTETKAYADGIVDAEEQRAIDDAQRKLSEAKADAQAKADNAESLAKQHANTQSAVAESNAKSYADGLKQQTDQTLTTYDSRISQNGQEISQRATKTEFNQSKKTLSQVISELTNSVSKGLTYTYDENGAIQSFNVGPGGITIDSSKININQGDVVIQNGVTTIKSLSADKIKVGFNNISSNINITNTGLQTVSNGWVNSIIDGTGHHFFNKDKYVGYIGTSRLTDEVSSAGLTFSLIETGNFVAFTYGESPTSDSSKISMMWAKNVGSYRNGFHFKEDVIIDKSRVLEASYIRPFGQDVKYRLYMTGSLWNNREGVSMHYNSMNGSSIHFSNEGINIVSTSSDGVLRGIDITGDTVVSSSIYNRTYSSASNVYITSYGTVGRSTSASKYKLSQEKQFNSEEKQYSHSKNILDLDIKTWYDRFESETYAKEIENEERIVDEDFKLKRYAGLIAEDVESVGLNEFVTYGKDDEIEGIEYDRLWIHLIPIVKQQQKEIENLKKQIGEMTSGRK